MQGTVAVLMALSGLGCHHKSHDVATYAPACYSAPAYDACYSSCYSAPVVYDACYSSSCYSAPIMDSCYSTPIYDACYSSACYSAVDYCAPRKKCGLFGGLFGKMPYYTAMAMGLFFAALGLPGLCGFPGEVFVVLSVWKFSPLLAILSASVVVLTAAYILWALQRVYLGAEYKGPHEDHITPSNFRENLIGTTLLVFAILFGVFPYQFPGGIPSVLKYMDASIDAQANALANWTRDVADADLPASTPAAETAEATSPEPGQMAAEPVHAKQSAPLEL